MKIISKDIIVVYKGRLYKFKQRGAAKAFMRSRPHSTMLVDRYIIRGKRHVRWDFLKKRGKVYEPDYGYHYWVSLRQRSKGNGYFYGLWHN